MTFRLAIGGISHETNTYAVASTGMTTLDRFHITRGDEILEQFAGTKTYIGGMVAAAEELKATIVPTLFAITGPSGTIEKSAYETMALELVSSILNADADVVALEVHGAGVVDGIDDLEGDLAGRVRRAVDKPLVCALDLHGNFTDVMADQFDLALGVHLYPHEDMYERGYETISLVPNLLDGTLKPVTHVEHLPILLAPSTTDTGFAAEAMNKVCVQIETNPGVIDCTVFHGFPFTDIPDVGMHVVAIANNDRDLAESSAKKVARWIWGHRDDFLPDLLTPEEAIQQALATEGRPIVINDTSDNPGGGTPGDATHVLRAFLDAKLTDACFGFISDAEVAQAAHAAGVGATIQVSLGGKHDELHGAPLEVTAYVKTLTDGKFVLQKIAQGMRMDHGLMARLLIDGIDVLVSSTSSQTFDPEVFLLHGIDVTRYKIVGLKSSNHFRAGYRDIAVKIITADAPGLTSRRVEVFDHTRATRPLWPVSEEARYP